MKIRVGDSDMEENVIQFKAFQDMSSEYKYRQDIVKELRAKQDSLFYQKQKLDENETRNLSYSEGFCRGYIEAVHKTMNKLHITTKEVQLQTLEALKKALCEDVDSTIRSLQYQLGDRYHREGKKP